MPSGNLTMQQMVARQVDLGTYAGPSFIIGHDKGGLVAHRADRDMSARPRSIVARKDLGLTKVEQLKGLKIANQTGSSVGNIFVDSDRAGGRPQEGRLPGSAHGRQQHGRRHGRQDRGRHGQRRALQRDRRVAEGIGTIDHGLLGASTRCRCSWRRRPISSTRARTPSSPISRPGWRSARDFKDNPDKVADVIYAFFTSKGYNMSRDTFAQGARPRRGRSRLPVRPRALPAAARRGAAAEKKISAIPDWKKALRPDLVGEGERVARSIVDCRPSPAQRDPAWHRIARPRRFVLTLARSGGSRHAERAPVIRLRGARIASSRPSRLPRRNALKLRPHFRAWRVE